MTALCFIRLFDLLVVLGYRSGLTEAVSLSLENARQRRDGRGRPAPGQPAEAGARPSTRG
jgi:hypothetical protein